MCMSACLHVCMCSMCMPCAQKWCQIPMNRNYRLYTVMSHTVGAENQTHMPCKGSKGSEWLSHRPGSWEYTFYAPHPPCPVLPSGKLPALLCSSFSGKPWYQITPSLWAFHPCLFNCFLSETVSPSSSSWPWICHLPVSASWAAEIRSLCYHSETGTHILNIY